MNPRIKLSSQKPFEDVAQAAKNQQPACVLQVVACLCFLHYQVSKEGRNAFFYRHLERLGITKVAEYDFPWADRVEGSKVYSRSGKRMKLLCVRVAEDG